MQTIKVETRIRTIQFPIIEKDKEKIYDLTKMRIKVTKGSPLEKMLDSEIKLKQERLINNLKEKKRQKRPKVILLD